MPRKSQFLCPTVLALSFLLTGAHAQAARKVIGYRTVNILEAASLLMDPKPSGDNHYIMDHEERFYQLGDIGYFYTTNIPPAVPGGRGDWYCVVTADSKKIGAAQKVYIPEYYVGDPSSSTIPKKWLLWGVEEETISRYIKTLSLPGGKGTPDPKKALRFSYIMTMSKPQLQMVIPDGLLRDDELDLKARCYDTKEKLEQESTGVVDWENWSIAGDPGDFFLPESQAP